MITGFAAGKTRGLCAKAIDHGVRYPNAKVLLGRKTYTEMVNTVKQPFFEMALPLSNAGWFLKPTRWDYREGTHHARLVNGSQFFFSNLDDPVKFRNEEYSFVGVDQAEELNAEVWETLVARVRWDKVPPEGWQTVAAANDQGHNWMWRRFVAFWQTHAARQDRCAVNPSCVFLAGHPDEEGEPRNPPVPCSTRRFFHGTTLDNKHNLKPRYLATLLSHPMAWQKHFIYATMEGGVGRLLPDPRTIPHVEPPAHWPRWRAIDHALNSPACCLWLTVNTDGKEVLGIPSKWVYVYREYWQGESSVDQHARRILDLSHNERVISTVMDRSTFHLTQSRQDGIRVSVADLYAEEGLLCMPSVGDPFARVERIIKCHNAGMVVSNACPHLIRQMPEYYAEASRETGLYKIVNKSDFHSVDALGYGLMVLPQDSQDLMEYDDRPEYLRRSGVDPADRRHHLLEWKRFKKIEEQEQLQTLGTLAFGVYPMSEFMGNGSELTPEYDPWREQ